MLQILGMYLSIDLPLFVPVIRVPFLSSGNKARDVICHCPSTQQVPRGVAAIMGKRHSVHECQLVQFIMTNPREAQGHIC